MTHGFSTGSVLTGAAFAALLAIAPAEAGGCAGQGCYRLVSTPPVYGSVAERVVVEPERTVSRIVPAEYTAVSERVMVHPARAVPRYEPPVYRTVAETVELSPAGKRWQVSRDHHGRLVGCWVEVPARFGVQHRQVLVSEGRSWNELVPAVYAERIRHVMVRPTFIARDTVPAVTSTRHRTVLVKPAMQDWVPEHP